MNESIKEKFSIKDMHCTSCEKLIANDVSEIDGVNSIKVSYGTETAEVEFDPSKTSINAIIKKIDDLGYSAKKINGNGKSAEHGITRNAGKHDPEKQKPVGVFGRLFGAGRE